LRVQLLSDGPFPFQTEADFTGDGDLAGMIRAFDWSSTPLGPIDRWPQSLKTITGFLLRSSVPIVLLWGRDGVMIYNDAYAVFAGGRHPKLLGTNVREGWPEVADFNDNVMKVGLGGGTLAYKDQELTLYRTGRPEPVWMNLDYSPVPDESGRPAGVIAIVIETTERVLADRRAAAERDRQRQNLAQMPGFAAVLAGPEHVYQYVNAAYLTIGGPRDYIGRSVREAFPELEGQGFYELLDQVYATGQRFVARAAPIRLTAETEDRYIDFLYEPIRDDGGAVSGIFVGGYDVTEAHRTAAALRELNADLER
jgi:PAS domain-containing protein